MTDDPTATIGAWGEQLRAIAGAGPALTERVADICRGELAKVPAAQQSVDGVHWRPRKMVGRGGKPRRDAVAKGPRVLVNAAEALSVTAIGTVVVIRLIGPEVIHHFRGRPFLPLGGVGKLGNAIRFGIVDMGDEFLNRAGRHDRGARGVKWRPKMGGSR